MFMKVLLLSCVLSVSSAFLLDSSTSLPPKNGLMTDDHYETLFRFFLDERKTRMQLQQYVLNLEAKFDTLAQQCNTCQSVSNQPPMTKPKNETEELEAKYQELTSKFESMKLKLEQELASTQNKTSMLEHEVINLKQVKSIDQLQTLSNVKQKVQTLTADIQSVIVSNQARSQDLIAMHNDQNTSKQRIIVLESNAKSMENNQSLIMASIKVLVDNSQQTLIAKIDNNTRQIQENNEYVGFTAFGAGHGLKSAGYQLKFPAIKSSFGISNVSSIKNTGTFICEKKGLYIILVTVMSCLSSGNRFAIYRNNRQFMVYYVGYSSGCDSGTGTAVVELHVGDAINVRNVEGNVDLYDSLSSFSAFSLN
ncbi:uncharacterized protein [Mytilus edulis]|uniref:uncharacterized protein n=1 Tax=Mytilus edulis TaxID=6550 RepID=UPI0039EE1B23